VPPTLALPVGVNVLAPPSVGQVIVPMGSQAPVSVRLLDSGALARTVVTVSSSNLAVATVEGAVAIELGEQVAQVVLSTGSAGEALLTFRVGEVVRQLSVVVGAPPSGRVPPVLAPPVGFVVLPPGTAGTLFLDVESSRLIVLRLPPEVAMEGALVQANSADPQAADIAPTAVTVPVGQAEVAFTVTTGASNAEALITLRFGNEVQTMLVVVGLPTAERVPLTVAPSIEVDVR
jgi:hypothetical protein